MCVSHLVTELGEGGNKVIELDTLTKTPERELGEGVNLLVRETNSF